MKRLFVGGTLVLGMLFGWNVVRAEAQAAGRIAYINMDQLFAQAPGTAEARTALEADAARFRTELEGLQTNLQTLQDNLTRQEATLTAAVRQQRANEISEKLVQFQTRQQELDTEYNRRQSELAEPIMRRINLVVDNIRSEGNYAIIFDVAGGGFAAADPALDLTNQVLSRLQNAAATTPPATDPVPPAGAPVSPGAPAPGN